MKYFSFYILCFITALFLCFGSDVSAQATGKELKVGDKMPGVVFNNVYNYSKQKIRLTDFKGKVVILDIWSSWCGGCIELFPHMDSLQKLYGDKLQVLLVNGRSKMYKDDRKKIANILDKVSERVGKKLSVPVVYDNPYLDELFPFKILPHEIVIDKNGYIVGITHGEEISFKNIKLLLEGKPVFFSTKSDVMNYDDKSPLFINGNGGSGGTLISQSVLLGYTEGISAMTGYPDYGDSLRTTYRIINHPLMRICEAAYPKLGGWPSSRIVFNVKDPSKYAREENTEEDINEKWKRYFCYELVMPGKRTMEEMMDYLRDDLKRDLNISFSTERRMIKCYFLTASDPVNRILSDGGNEERNFYYYSPKNYIKNWKIENVIQFFNWYFPLYDLTGITKRVSIEIPKTRTEENMKQALLSAGFLLSSREMEVEVIVISDK